MEETTPTIYGMDYLIDLSFAETDRSALHEEDKRALLFSLYAFRALFDNAAVLVPRPQLVKHNLSFLIEPQKHPAYEKNKAYFDNLKQQNVTYVDGGGIYTEYLGKNYIKFDCGSDLYFEAVSRGLIDAKNAPVPKKLSLYEMVLKTVESSQSKELKAMWYLFFPYVILSGAPEEYGVIDRLKGMLVRESVFEDALNSKYSEMVFATKEEMKANDLPALVNEWYCPFIDYKNSLNDEGFMLVTAMYMKELARGNFKRVIEGTDRLLDSFPADYKLILLNVSARVSSLENLDQNQRVMVLAETLNIINCALGDCHSDKDSAYLYYYRGLVNLGLSAGDNSLLAEAVEDLETALRINPSFELAAFMLKAITKKS